MAYDDPAFNRINYPPEVENMPPGAWGPQGMKPIPSSAVKPSGLQGGNDAVTEQLRAQAYATIAADPAGDAAHDAREFLASLPKIQVGQPSPGSVEPEPSHDMLVAQFMQGRR